MDKVKELFKKHYAKAKSKRVKEEEDDMMKPDTLDAEGISQ